MSITLDGTGSIDGLSVGGLPNGVVTPADLSQPLTLATAVASTSGTAIDFTGVPSWVKRITVMLAGVSTNGSALHQIQLGTTSGVETSGYVGDIITNGAGASSTTGFLTTWRGDSNQAVRGSFTLCLQNQNTNTWVFSGVASPTGAASSGAAGGDKTLSGVLTRIRLTTVNGTDVFDAGSINIMYEG